MTTYDKANILALSGGSAMNFRNTGGLDNTASMGITASAGGPQFSSNPDQLLASLHEEEEKV